MVKLTKRSKAELICIALLLLLNPATWYLARGPENVFPDSVAYMTMGANILSDGLFHVPAWGHVDVGLVLPPLYPLLIAFFRLFTGGDVLVAARLLTTIFMLGASVLGFLYLSRMRHWAVATCAVLLIQLNAHYLSLATTPLTEPLFIFFTLAALLLWQRLIRDDPRWPLTCLLLGLTAGLVYLSRQIGLVVVAWFVIFTLVHGLATMRERLKEVLLRALLVLAGATILVAPYLLIVKTQTGHWPTEQRFRMGGYTVTAPDAGTAREVEEIRAFEAPDYETLYNRRRAWMKLTPEGSEMLSYVLLEGDIEGAEAAIPELRLPKQTGSRLLANFGFLGNFIGTPIALLFLVTAVLAMIGYKRPKPFFARSVLPLMILFYLLSISLVTGLVERYLVVLFPLVVLQIFSELYAFTGMIGEKPGIKGLREGILAVILFIGLVATPQLYHDIHPGPWLSMESAPLAEFSAHLEPGDPAISVVPQFAFYAGGSYRHLPNDSLEQTVAYARKTGVKWLVVTRDQGSLDEAALYTNASWFSRGRPDQTHPHLLKFTARSADGFGYLFEIRPDAG